MQTNCALFRVTRVYGSVGCCHWNWLHIQLFTNLIQSYAAPEDCVYDGKSPWRWY